jgi:hypothetical protein
MSEDSVSRWFKGLQPLELVEVLRDFLGAEANRVDGSTGDVHFSTAIYNRRRCRRSHLPADVGRRLVSAGP